MQIEQNTAMENILKAPLVSKLHDAGEIRNINIAREKGQGRRSKQLMKKGMIYIVKSSKSILPEYSSLERSL